MLLQNNDIEQLNHLYRIKQLHPSLEYNNQYKNMLKIFKLNLIKMNYSKEELTKLDTLVVSSFDKQTMEIHNYIKDRSFALKPIYIASSIELLQDTMINYNYFSNHSNNEYSYLVDYLCSYFVDHGCINMLKFAILHNFFCLF